MTNQNEKTFRFKLKKHLLLTSPVVDASQKQKRANCVEKKYSRFKLLKKWKITKTTKHLKKINGSYFISSLIDYKT